MGSAKRAKTSLKLAATKPHGFHEVDDDKENPASQDESPSPSQRFMSGGSVSAEQLRTVIERIEKLEEEKSGIGADIREVFSEAKGNGFDVKAIKQILKIRRMDENERNEQTAVLETYMQALGMLPLFEGLEEEKA